MRNKIFEDYVAKLPSLEGKVVAISGTTSGTGFHAAHACTLKNVDTLLLLNRASARAEGALTKLQKMAEKAGLKTNIMQVECDLMSFESVKKAADKVEEIAKPKGGLDVLCNNAGIMGFPDQRTVDGYDQQMQTNHISSFLLVQKLIPVLLQAQTSRGDARIVNHSSGARNASLGMNKELKGHLDGAYFDKCEAGTLGGDKLGANFARYHQSKLANGVFTMELTKRFKAAGIAIKVVAADPGVATTDLGSNLASAQSSCCLKNFVACCNPCVMACVFPLFAQSGPDGSCPLLASCFAPEAESGDFYVPVKTTKGIPVKAIQAGQENLSVVKEGSERFTLNAESGTVLWEKSVAAVGEIKLE